MDAARAAVVLYERRRAQKIRACGSGHQRS
jgi:hypothetical protein